MCGRFSMYVDNLALAKAFDLEYLTNLPPLPARYNVAPSQPVAVIRFDPETNKRKLNFMSWGFIPTWMNSDGKRVEGYINAQCEEIEKKNSFKNAFRHRRCLVVATGFY